MQSAGTTKTLALLLLHQLIRWPYSFRMSPVAARPPQSEHPSPCCLQQPPPLQRLGHELPNGRRPVDRGLLLEAIGVECIDQIWHASDPDCLTPACSWSPAFFG
jgi:hypothetical protein